MRSRNGSSKRYRGVYHDPKTDTWFYSVVTGKHPDSRPKRQLRRGFATAKEADRARRDVLKNVEVGTHVEPSREMVGEFLPRWLAANKASVRPSTWASYEMNVRAHIAPEIGGLRLQDLTPDRLNALYGKLLEAGLSASTVAYCHVIIFGALDDAERWGDVVRNVAKLANPPKRRQGKAKMKTWSPEELSSFLMHAREDRLYPAFLVAATTGMRRGEVLGLSWRDVDLEVGRASITQTLVLVNHEAQFSTPKTDSGRRTVPIPPDVVRALREWSIRQEPNETGLVFTDPQGRPVHPAHFSKLFNGWVRRAGLPRIRLHDLRHTWATLALGAGVPLKVASEILGHSSIAVTADLYSHVNPSMMEQAMATVAAVVFGAAARPVGIPLPAR